MKRLRSTSSRVHLPPTLFRVRAGGFELECTIPGQQLAYALEHEGRSAAFEWLATECLRDGNVFGACSVRGLALNSARHAATYRATARRDARRFKERTIVRIVTPCGPSETDRVREQNLERFLSEHGVTR